MSWHQLRSLRKELAFLNDQRLETLTLQLEREDLPVLYPQLTSEWFIEGLNFCCESWRYQTRRSKPTVAPPPPRRQDPVLNQSAKKVTGTDSR